MVALLYADEPVAAHADGAAGAIGIGAGAPAGGMASSYCAAAAATSASSATSLGEAMIWKRREDVTVGCGSIARRRKEPKEFPDLQKAI